MRALLLILALAGAASAADDGSLEAFLRRLRAERDAVHDQLRDPVRALVERLESLDDPGRAELERVRKELDGLGPEAGPLLVEYIDPEEPPRENPAKGREVRAREITNALKRMRAPGIVGALVELSTTGSEVGRIHAVEILGTSPEPDRAGAQLEELFRTAKGRLRIEVIKSLASLGGERNEPTLRAALTDSNPEVVGTVLDALTEARSVEAAPAILNLARVPDAASRVSDRILAYYLAVPSVVGEEVLDALVDLALSKDVELESRIAILGGIPRFEASHGTKLRRRLEPITDASNTSLREAGLVCLAVLGDRNARRELMKTYDDLVQTNDDWPDAYERRAQVLLEIGEYNDAARDFRRAIDLLGNRARQGAYKKLWIELARAYVRGNKLRQASDTLREVNLSEDTKRELAADPDFAPLRDHSRYGKVLE